MKKDSFRRKGIEKMLSKQPTRQFPRKDQAYIDLGRYAGTYGGTVEPKPTKSSWHKFKTAIQSLLGWLCSVLVLAGPPGFVLWFNHMEVMRWFA